MTESGDAGILVSESDGTELISNTSHLMSDSGISLNAANDGVVRDNDVRFSPGGLQLDGSNRNLIESNNASNTAGIGIELGGDSLENVLVGNTATENGAQGIYLGDEAAEGTGNLVSGNTASRNSADGIATAKGGHTVISNVARDNGGWGINAGLGTIDGGDNAASGNSEPAQCSGVVCTEPASPDTEITERPSDPSGSSSATFGFTSSDDSTTNLTFECRLDSQDEPKFEACTSPMTYSDLADGTHTFVVRALDSTGGVDPTPAAHTWRVDLTPPETTIDFGPNASTTSTSARFMFSASEAASTLECSLDGAPFDVCTSPRDYTGLAVGGHEFHVRATDQAGNTDATTAGYAWTISPPPRCALKTITTAPSCPRWRRQGGTRATIPQPQEGDRQPLWARHHLRLTSPPGRLATAMRARIALRWRGGSPRGVPIRFSSFGVVSKT